MLHRNSKGSRYAYHNQLLVLWGDKQREAAALLFLQKGRKACAQVWYTAWGNSRSDHRSQAKDGVFCFFCFPPLVWCIAATQRCFLGVFFVLFGGCAPRWMVLQTWVCVFQTDMMHARWPHKQKTAKPLFPAPVGAPNTHTIVPHRPAKVSLDTYGGRV